jgi:hypothetical protein
MFFNKKQQEALGSQVKALIKEKTGKENVMTDLELINLNNASLLQSKELKRKTTEAKIEQFTKDKMEYQKSLQHLQTHLERAHE